MKHTPGPWKVSIQPKGGHNEHVNTCVKVSIPTFGTHIQSAVFFSKHGHLQDESDMANANLIAAAPDLLKAAKMAVEAIENNARRNGAVGYGCDPYFQYLLGAIAKAEGEEHET